MKYKLVVEVDGEGVIQFDFKDIDSLEKHEYLMGQDCVINGDSCITIGKTSRISKDAIVRTIRMTKDFTS